MKQRSVVIFALLLFNLLAISGCEDNSKPVGASNKPIIAEQAIGETYIEQGDFKQLKARGKLRILAPKRGDIRLPRQGTPLDIEQDLAINFAQSLGLEPVLIYIENFDNVISDLQQGKGDLIVANLTVTKSRKQQIAFTVPIAQIKEQLVAQRNHGANKKTSIKKIADLKNQTIAVKKNTSHEETVKQLQKIHPSIKLEILSGNLTNDDILDKIADKKIDFAVLDSNLLTQASDYRDDFSIALDLTKERPLAWGVRKDNPDLLERLNRYLNQQQLADTQENLFTGDLDALDKRKKLRVLTRNNSASYYLWRGELLGFEYELVKAYAKEKNLRLEIVVADSHEALIPMLVEGKGDIIAAFMTDTELRQKQGIKFSRSYHSASEIVVARAKDKKLSSPKDLVGRTFHVRRSSAYWKSLEALKSTGINFELQAVPETMETEEIIGKVATGEYDLTLSDSHILDIELTSRNDIIATFSIGEPRKNAWAVRENNPKLLASINAFHKKVYRGSFFNITYKKYFKNSRKIKKHKKERLERNADGSISPYDALVMKYSDQYGFDWRMIVAQMYQESRFNPKAKSWVGAKGLMQVMPRTAKELKLTDLENPDIGIHAGVKYMKWVRNRFEPELDVKDRMWFSLAAYNAGAGHVKDARRLALQKGWDPNRWFNNVEKALLLLSKRKYAKKARHGYVRGLEPVNYVRQIKQRYNAYIRLRQE